MSAGSTPAPPEFSATDRFFFDLNGFLVVRGVLSAEEVATANAAIDAHSGEIRERLDPELRNSREGSELSGSAEQGRRDLGGVLSWPPPHREPFRQLLAHPGLVPYITALCGRGFRLDHQPLVITQKCGSEGFALHGGPLTGAGGLNPALQYRCFNGEIFNSLLAMSVQLSDHGPGDGGFCVVRGSHKMNLPMPDGLRHGEAAFREHMHQPTTRAGDVVFFSEATVHGATPWRAEHERRIALYRFAPATCAYGRAYCDPTWPEAVLEGLSPRARAVLEPPYHGRMDRPLVLPGVEELTVEGRSQKKKDFDQEVFGTRYF